MPDPANPAYNWPELHQTPALNGFAYNSPLSSTNASRLGVVWAADLFGAALDSPAAAYDPVLHETLAYIGTENGIVDAVNVANGQIVWGAWLGSPIRSSPVVWNGSVYIGTFTNPKVVRFNATTGAIDCSILLPRPLEGTPTLATPPGGVPTLFIGSEDTGSTNGPFEAINADTCALRWSFTGYALPNGGTTGNWGPASYTVAVNGTPLVIFGTSDSDSGIYAVNATSGQLVWHFRAYNPPPGVYDIGAGAAISPPGRFGFPEGAAFIPSKYGIMYALNLSNGIPIWSTNFDQLAGLRNGSDGGRSSPALDGSNLIFGFTHGLVNLNAANGKLVWLYNDSSKTESIASPAIAGGHGTGIVVTDDLSGSIDVLSVVGGRPLYQYQTGGYATASPAIVGGNILTAGSDGFLYDLAVGGGNNDTPSATITSPGHGQSLPNPNGNLTVFGNASDGVGLAGVQIAVQADGVNGPWWDAANGTWVTGPSAGWATLVSPGSTASAWTFRFPPAVGGGSYVVSAYAVSTNGQSQIHVALTSFSVSYSTSGPHLALSVAYAPPGSSVIVNGGGFGRSVQVDLRLGASALANLTSTANGSLPPIAVKIPWNAPFGPSAILADAPSTNRSTSAPLDIANDWAASGYGATRQGYEPNDSVLNYLVHPGGVLWVERSWHFTPGPALTTSPALVDGVLYVGDANGNVYALDNENGGILWNWTQPGGQAIVGSPAVDLAAGLLFVGTSRGLVEAIHLANGTGAWSYSLGGQIASPVVAGGYVYAASTNGQIAACAESNGTVRWSTALGSPVTSLPSLNATVHLLVVGLLNGNLTALNSTSGALVWSYATGSAIDAAATLWDGEVYVGSTNGIVYALRQSSGALVWSYSTGGSITASGTIDTKYTFNAGKPEYAVGNSRGTLTVLSAANGSFFFSNTQAGRIVGVASVQGVIIWTTATGLITATRAYTNLDMWKFTAKGSDATAPIIVDGAVYAVLGNGVLNAFTTFGQAPD